MGRNVELCQLLENKKLFVFDFDGTLLDSMPMWDHVGTDYIRSQGIEPPADLEERLVSKTLEESGQFYIEELGLNKTVDEYIKDIYNFVYEKYKNELPLKAGAYDYVKKVHGQGKKLCILTTSGRPVVEAAMDNHGLQEYIHFDKVFTCGELKMNKRSPELYKYVCKIMGEDPKDCVCFEDAPFAVKNGHEAGLTAVAVYDPSAISEADKSKVFADYCIDSFEDLL